MKSLRVGRGAAIALGLCVVVGVLGALTNGGKSSTGSATVVPKATSTAVGRQPAQLPPTSAPRPTSVLATATPEPTKPDPTARPAGPVAAQNANLRAGPGTAFAKVGSVKAGGVLEIVGRNESGEWLELKDGRWIAAFLVANAPAAVPIAAGIPVLPTTASRAAPAQPALPSADVSTCDCSGNLYNCSDFQAFDAQACYLRCLKLVGTDVHDLDRDHDGSACEWEY